MTDRELIELVEQLRALEKREAGNCYSVNKAMLDAAAEIERLRTALEAQSARIAELEGLLQQAWVNLVDAYDMCTEEIDRASPAKHLSKRIDRTVAAIRAALPSEVKP